MKFSHAFDFGWDGLDTVMEGMYSMYIVRISSE
jgi:hypothetical protein